MYVKISKMITRILRTMISNFDYGVVILCVYNFVCGFEVGMYTRYILKQINQQNLNPALLVTLNRMNIIWMYSSVVFSLVGIFIKLMTMDTDDTAFVKLFTNFGLIVSVVCQPSTDNIYLTLFCLFVTLVTEY